MLNKDIRVSFTFFTISVIFLLLVTAVSLTNAQIDTSGLDNRAAWPPVTPRVNATVSPLLVWSFDWTVVGCSFFAIFGGLANGPMAALTIQRFRALRQPIAQQCSWEKQYENLILNSTNNFTSILDRADSPTGLSMTVEGGEVERFIVGAFWWNAALAVFVLGLQLAIAVGLEKYTLKKAKEANGEDPTTSAGQQNAPSMLFDNNSSSDLKNRLFYIATKWGFGRVLVGVCVLPCYSAFRLAMIIVSNGTSSDAVLTTAKLAIAVHLIILALVMLVAPSIASRRCFTQSRLQEIKENQKQSFLAWLTDDRARWRFEKMDDFKAMVVVASVENIFKEDKWWVVPFELAATVAIDLGPLAAPDPNKPQDACFVNCLTGLILTTFLWWFILYLRPFQRRYQHMCWFIQLSGQNWTYLLGVLQEQQTAPVPSKREAFIVLGFISCFTSLFVTFIFTFLPLIRRIADRISLKKEGENGKFNFNFEGWHTEFLSMLQTDQGISTNQIGLSSKHGGGAEGTLDEELINGIMAHMNGSGGAGDNNNNNNNSTDGILNHFSNARTRGLSLALPSSEYSPAASKSPYNPQRNIEDDEFLREFLAPSKPSAAAAAKSPTTPNHRVVEQQADGDDVPPPPEHEDTMQDEWGEGGEGYEGEEDYGEEEGYTYEEEQDDGSVPPPPPNIAWL